MTARVPAHEVMLLLAAAAAVAAAAAAAASSPGPYNINETMVAGLSAGAFLAVQYHVAFSDELAGAGVIAGGPFQCAEDNYDTAVTACMSVPSMLKNGSYAAAAVSCHRQGLCDDPKGLARQRVWLFSGADDYVVRQGVMRQVAAMYGELGLPAAAVATNFDTAAEHCWPTVSYGNPCEQLGSPFISRCNLDAAAEMVAHVLDGASRPPAAGAPAPLLNLSQGAFTPDGEDPATFSMGPEAYVYAPDACARGQACRLVISMHGCDQTVDDIGLDFVKHTGMNEVAEANNLVVLYPQVIKTAANKKGGCADWWGYTGSHYATQKGPQLATIHAMARSLAGAPLLAGE